VKILASNTVFHVSDLEKSVQFYTEILGFDLKFQYGSPPSYAGLCFGEAHLHLSCSYPYKNNTGHGNLYLIGDEVESIYSRCVEQGVDFYSHIEQRDYGLVDFAIKDPDGNQIGYGAQAP